MTHWKKVLLPAVCAGLAAAMPVTSFAASKITSVTIELDSAITVGDSDSEVDGSTDSDKYYVDTVEEENEPENDWEEGDQPELKITLEAEDDYIFNSGFSEKKVKVKGVKGEVTSAKRSGSRTLIVSFTMDGLEDDNEYELDLEDLSWDQNSAAASWNGGYDAESYEIRLYRGSTVVSPLLSTTDIKYDLSPYFTAAGDYKFRVRGVHGSQKGEWHNSPVWTVNAEKAAALSAGKSAAVWIQDTTGWWYRNADGSYTVNNWQYIGDKWYFFDGTGYMKTGWIDWNGKWYYCDSSGAMLSNTTTPDGYQVGADGAWIQAN